MQVKTKARVAQLAQAEKEDTPGHDGTPLDEPPRPGSRAAQVVERRELQDQFLKVYTAVGTISGASQQTGVPRRSHYDWLENDPTYAERYAEAHDTAVDRAEQELRRRGVVGYDRPVFHGGKQVGTIREYSDACLIFYLKGRRRDVFGERMELGGPGGGPIVINPLAERTEAELVERTRELLARIEGTQRALGPGDDTEP